MAKKDTPSQRQWAQHVRERIQATQIVNRLHKAFEGQVEMTAVQAKIGLGLLAKVLPDMSHHINETVQSEDVNQILERARAMLGPDADKLLAKYIPIAADAKQGTNGPN